MLTIDGPGAGRLVQSPTLASSAGNTRRSRRTERSCSHSLIAISAGARNGPICHRCSGKQVESSHGPE